MKFSIKTLLVFVLIINLNISAQSGLFEFLPDSLQFVPLKANHQEARVGILYYPETGYLKVDIGNNIDLLKFNLSDETSVNVGIEFMAYALSTNYQGKRLQIDALDGFFGGHASAKFGSGNSYYLSRLRIIHNSAHFVDGHYDFRDDKWRDNIEPIPFTQDFGELTVAGVNSLGSVKIRCFASIAYSTLVRPHIIKKYSGNFGVEVHSDSIIGSAFNHPVNLFFANYNRYAGMPKYNLSTSNQAGVKFGEWNGKGIVLYLSYYYGNDILSEYYFKRDSKFGIGFTADFN